MSICRSRFCRRRARAGIGCAVARPELIGLGGDEVERHLDALGVLRAFADFVQDRRQFLISGRRIELERELFEDFIFPDKALALAGDHHAVGFDVLDMGAAGEGLARVAHDERIDAAPRAGIGDARQACDGLGTEIGGEIRDDRNQPIPFDAHGLWVWKKFRGET